MQLWEYWFVPAVLDSKLQDTLTQAGLSGWELVSWHYTTLSVHLVFKRPSSE